MKVTALMDNLASEHKGLIVEHGLSLLLERDDFRMLFDCGQGRHALDNAHRLGVDLGNLDAVVLSHSHYDHAAGYRDLIENGFGSRILITGTHFFEKKYAISRGCYADLSCGFNERFLEEHDIKHITCSSAIELVEGIWIISGFKRKYEFETIADRFVKTSGKMLPNGTPEIVKDDFADEVCLAVDTPGGVALFVGCSHPGILNITEHVHTVLRRPVTAVYGGTHLVEADELRIKTTVSRLRELGLVDAGFSHCSGDIAEQIIEEEGDIVGSHLATGSVIFLPETEL